MIEALIDFHTWYNTPQPQLMWLYTAFRVGSWVACGLLFISIFRLWRTVPRQVWFVAVMIPALLLFLYYTDQIFLADRTLRPTPILMVFNGSLAVFFAAIARLATKLLPGVQLIVGLSENVLEANAPLGPPSAGPSS